MVPWLRVHTAQIKFPASMSGGSQLPPPAPAPGIQCAHTCAHTCYKLKI